MTDTAAHAAHPPDICLLLRVHAEQRWLVSRVIPLLRQLEDESSAGQDLGPALAYLEVLWLEAGLRAAETDAAAATLDPGQQTASTVLHQRARRYHAAVRRLRHAVDRRVRRLTCPTADLATQEPAGS
ncbi:MAG: hypothetical protein ACLQBB_13985 [Solirubrobacteraceae bacterium]